MVILQLSDILQLSESSRGRVCFQNGRKHIVISFLTDHQWVTETGRAGTESREPTHGPARNTSAHRREGRHHRPLTHCNKKPGSNTHQWPHRSAATSPLPHGKGGGMGRQTHLGAQTRTMQRRPVRRTPKMPLEEKTPGAPRSAATGSLPHGKGGGTGRQTHLGARTRTTQRTATARRHKKKPPEEQPPRALRGGGYLLSHPC